MIIVLYIFISHFAFIVQMSQGWILTDRNFFDALFWSYCWPYEILRKPGINPYYLKCDKYITRITDWNEKFRNLMYFILFGIGEEFSN